MVLYKKSQLFPRKNLVLGCKTNFFLGKSWFLAKNQLFPRKKKKKQTKNIFWETIRPNSRKIVFLVFPGKKLGKRWFWTKKQTFS